MITLAGAWTSSVQQQCYRHLLDALSYPGRVQRLDPALTGVHAAVAVLASLCDGGSTLADPHAQLSAQDLGLLAAVSTDPAQAAFVVLDGRRAPADLPRPQTGTLEEPELGATLIIIVDQLGAGPLTLRASGPGIPDQRTLSISGLHADWLQRRAAWIDYPLGVDVVLADAQTIAALPRTTTLTWES